MGEKKKMKVDVGHTRSLRSQRVTAAATATPDSSSSRRGRGLTIDAQSLQRIPPTVSRKRRAQSSPSANSVDAFDDHSSSRGRPPRVPVSASASATPSASLMNSSARRSKRRTFAVDPNKPLLVLRPNDDLKERFGLGEKELSELLATLKEDPSDDPFAVRFDDLSSGPATPSAAQIVFIPRVATAVSNSDSTSSSLHGASKFSSSQQSSQNTLEFEDRRHVGRRSVNQKNMKSPQSGLNKLATHSVVKLKKKKHFAPPDFETVKRGSKYVEYDMDSGDEDFLDTTLPDALRKKRERDSNCKICANCRSQANKKVKNDKYVKVIKRCVTKSCVHYNAVPSSDMISPQIFEKMISILERELEVAKLFLKERIRADLQGLVTKNLIDDGYSSLVHINQFLNLSSNSTASKSRNSSNSMRTKALTSLEKAFEHSRGEDACISRKASTASIVTAAVAAASAAASGDVNAPDSIEDILATLSCPAPLAVLLSTVPRNSPRGPTHTSSEAAAVFTSTLNRSASQNSMTSTLTDDVQQFQALSGTKESIGNASPRSCGSGSPRNSLRNEDIQTNSQYFTSEHLHELVPEDRVVLVLARVMSFSRDGEIAKEDIHINGQSQSSSLRTRNTSQPNEVSKRSIPYDTTSSKQKQKPTSKNSQVLDPELRSLLGEVYNYWVDKRSNHLDSLLRCYHNFMMDEWHQAPSMPPLPEDFNIEELKKGHMELHRLRFDLDRARLIVDRVRRRERIKKELIKLSSDNFDKVLSLVRQTQDCSRSPVTTVKMKASRHGSKKEIDRCKIVSKLPSMLKKRQFSLHAEENNLITHSSSNALDGSDNDANDNDMDTDDAESNVTEHQGRNSRNNNRYVVATGKGHKDSASKRDVVVVSTGRPVSRRSSSEGPSLRKRTNILAGRRISRASDEVNLKVSEETSFSSGEIGNENSFETSSVSSSTTTSNSTGIRVPNGNRNSRGSLDSNSKSTKQFSKSISMVSIPKLKKGVTDHNSIRARSTSPSVLSENQKWSSLAVKSAMKKAIVVPEVVDTTQRKLRNVPARLVKPPATRTPLKRVAKKATQSVDNDSSSSGSGSSSEDEDEDEDEKNEDSQIEESSEESDSEDETNNTGVNTRSRRFVEAPRTVDSDSESESASESESEEDSGNEDKDDKKRLHRISPRLASSSAIKNSRAPRPDESRSMKRILRPKAVTMKQQSPVTSRLLRSAQHQHEASDDDSSRNSSDDSASSDSDDEEISGSDNDTDGLDGETEDTIESENDASPGIEEHCSKRSRPRRLSTNQVQVIAPNTEAIGQSDSSVGGFGSRSAKRGTYSPALCSLSGLARPFMSGGGFSSFCFS